MKSPHFSRWLAGLLDDGRVEVEHVVIPIRDLDVAAASRVRMARYGADLHTWGGLFGTTRATRQREALAVIEYELMFTIARHDVPHTLLEFPRFAEDWRYTYDKLGFLDPTIPADRWRTAVGGRVRPELIHEDAAEPPASGGSPSPAPPTTVRSPARSRGGVALRLASGSRRTASCVSDRDVTAYIANLNTARVTELCIRSMREFAGTSFELVVGDCGSTDGSLQMLERFASHGWLRARRSRRTVGPTPTGSTGGCASARPRYALFSDSDVEFAGARWLTDMVGRGRDVGGGARVRPDAARRRDVRAPRHPRRAPDRTAPDRLAVHDRHRAGPGSRRRDVRVPRGRGLRRLRRQGRVRHRRVVLQGAVRRRA